MRRALKIALGLLLASTTAAGERLKPSGKPGGLGVCIGAELEIAVPMLRQGLYVHVTAVVALSRCDAPDAGEAIVAALADKEIGRAHV